MVVALLPIADGRPNPSLRVPHRPTADPGYESQASAPLRRVQFRLELHHLSAPWSGAVPSGTAPYGTQW